MAGDLGRAERGIRVKLRGAGYPSVYGVPLKVSRRLTKRKKRGPEEGGGAGRGEERRKKKGEAGEFIGQFIVTTNPRRYRGLD